MGQRAQEQTEDTNSIKHGMKQLERVAGRSGNDTIRLWESYREQAFLWRALALIQMPATFVAVLIALVMYFFADTVIHVPQKPQPGHYSVKQLPDDQFINVAQEVINLVASYQPATARTQFLKARKYLWEPALSEFEKTMMKSELRAIEETSRSQLFFINPNLIRIARFHDEDKIEVRVPGTRQKLIGQKPLAPDDVVFYIKMTTIPRNVANEYGIVVIDIKARKPDSETGNNF